MMLIDVKFNIGSPVYLTTDTDQRKRIIVGYYIDSNSVSYLIRCGTEESTHYDFEISEEINLTIRN
jgi:hypothetical protein